MTYKILNNNSNNFNFKNVLKNITLLFLLLHILNIMYLFIYNFSMIFIISFISLIN